MTKIYDIKQFFILVSIRETLNPNAVRITNFKGCNFHHRNFA